ncbi:lipoate--protein ligase family protein [Paenirhodobacter sp.]|uniref:lipoate--protein ligase family protein n=1 Tax=Paenirhodobacter sp. TaxID=1965326 RepID=UPI003B422F8F
MIRFPTAAEGIAAELALPVGGVLLWEAQARAIVLPQALSHRAGFEAATSASAARGWPLILRGSGGGAVPQGPGGINLALCLAVEGHSIGDIYREICAPIQRVLAARGIRAEPGATPDSFCDGSFNLGVGGRKIVGTAQRWRAGGRALAHALILFDPPLDEGVAAVDALHRDLGLPPIRREVHATIRDFLPGLMPSDFVAALKAAL